MESSSVMRALPRVAAFGCLVLGAAVTTSSRARAEPAEGTPALRQARAAWDKRAFSKAETFYRQAIEKGGLLPAEIVEGYVRLGASRAALGKKAPAIAAFRAASVLDAGFVVPPEGGHRGAALAARAKKDTQKIGSIQLALTTPTEAASGSAFTCTSELDTPHVKIVSKLSFLARDPESSREIVVESKPAPAVDFEVPASLAHPGSTLRVRIDALDKHGNRLASAEDEVHVAEPATAPPVMATGPAVNPAPSAAIGPPPPASKRGDGAAERSGGGFWSTPWPYLIGGVALAGAGTAVYIGTRPADEVSVGQVGVRTR